MRNPLLNTSVAPSKEKPQWQHLPPPTIFPEPAEVKETNARPAPAFEETPSEPTAPTLAPKKLTGLNEEGAVSPLF